MKRIVKIVGIFLIIFLILVVGLGFYITHFLPKIDVNNNLKVEVTAERIKRGDYLANHVNACMDCHSTRGWTKFSGPLIPGTLGKGGEVFDQSMGLPGIYVAPNITPFHLKDWTDGEIYRAITSGVSKDGRPLFPVMPYMNYGTMDDEDLYSIIAYIRSIDPIEAEHPKPKSDFPMNFIIHLIPKKGAPVKIPSEENTLEYGKYLVNASGCIDCHTPFENGEYNFEMSFAGGREFPLPEFGTIHSLNITPDEKTGIGRWTKEMFVARFKAYNLEHFDPPTVSKGQFNTIMPWTMYAGMKESDLEAIYTYLRTLQPIENKIEVFTPLQ